jgi:hypothetical protein
MAQAADKVMATLLVGIEDAVLLGDGRLLQLWTSV